MYRKMKKKEKKSLTKETRSSKMTSMEKRNQTLSQRATIQTRMISLSLWTVKKKLLRKVFLGRQWRSKPKKRTEEQLLEDRARMHPL